MNEHLSDTVLAQYLDDALTAVQRQALEEHAKACDSCRRLVSGVRQLVSDVSGGSTAHFEHGDDAPTLPLVRGTEVGRYVLLERLGGGGMGVVYSAFDPALDRKVALKFIRDSLSAPDARRIAEREAKTMARLHHANVVSVFDVGVLANRTFLAMEYVEGATLQRWLGEQARTSREVGRVFLPAARGLEAVHAAGLVHGDFKPANVLLSQAGDIKVTDFGLARDASQFDAHLGGAGTIAYMAPEQLAGGHADAKSDQFAFCTALLSALESVPSDGTRRRLIALASRGTNANPALRYASMSQLAIEFERVLYAPPRSVLLLSFTALGALAVAGGLSLSRASPCESESLMTTTWNEGARSAVLAAFVRSSAAFAPVVGQTVVRELDAYAKHWAVARTEACVATNERHEQSPELLDLRIDCFERRRLELRALVRELEHAEGPTISRAADMVGALEPLERCDDRRALLEQRPQPSDSADRVALEAAWQQIALAKTARAAGRFKDASVAELALSRAEQTKQPYLEAEALVLLADFQELAKSPATAWRALAVAERGHHDVAKAQALFKILEGEVSQTQSQQRTDELIALARAVVARAGNPPLLTFALNRSVGAALRRAGRVSESIDVLRSALEVAERSDAVPAHLRANGYNTLGVALMTEGRNDEALPMLQRARETLVRTLGTDHPLVAQTEVNLGGTLSSLLRFEEADVMLAHAEKVYERSLPSPNTFMPGVLINRAEVELSRGKLAHALELSERARTLYVEASGPNSANAALGRTQTGHALYLLGRYHDAVVELAEARRIVVQLKGVDAAELVDVLELLGLSQAALDQPRDALLTLKEAVRVGALTRGDGTCEAAKSRYSLATVMIALGEYSNATTQLDQALRACEHRQDGIEVTALVRFELARERWRREPSPSALADAQRAMASYAALQAPEPARLVAMRTWLERRK